MLKFLKLDNAFSRYGNSLITSEQIVENLILRKKLLKFRNLGKGLLYYSNQKSIFAPKCCSGFMSNPSSNLEVLNIPKYVINLKVLLRTIF